MTIIQLCRQTLDHLSQPYSPLSACCRCQCYSTRTRVNEIVRDLSEKQFRELCTIIVWGQRDFIFLNVKEIRLK